MNEALNLLFHKLDLGVFVCEPESHAILFSNSRYNDWFPQGILKLLSAEHPQKEQWKESLPFKFPCHTTPPQGQRKIPVEIFAQKESLNDKDILFFQIKDTSKILEKDLMLKSFSAVIDQSNKKLSLQKKALSELLDNMQEAVFSVDSDLSITSPTSAHSQIIFGQPIEGLGVFDVVFPNLSPSSEALGRIKTALISCFGEGTLQWEMSCDDLPKRVERQVTQGYPQLLDISYTPIFDDHECLERILFVVRDITELQRLERQIDQERKVGQENIQMIQELAELDKASVEQFFNASVKLLQEALHAAKQVGQNPGAIHELFRHIHTFKGNARAFQFSLLSAVAHEVEHAIVTLRDDRSPSDSHSPGAPAIQAATGVGRMSKPLTAQIEDIRSQLRQYTRLAKRVFGIEDEFELGIMGHMQRLICQLDEHLGEAGALHLCSPEQQHSTRPLSESSLKHVIETTHTLKSTLMMATHPDKGALNAVTFWNPKLSNSKPLGPLPNRRPCCSRTGE